MNNAGVGQSRVRRGGLALAILGLLVTVGWLVLATPSTRGGLLTLTLIAGVCGGVVAALTTWSPAAKAGVAAAAVIIGLIVGFLAVPQSRDGEPVARGSDVPSAPNNSAEASASTESPTDESLEASSASPTDSLGSTPSESTDSPSSSADATTPFPSTSYKVPQIRHQSEIVYTSRSRSLDLDAPKQDSTWGRGDRKLGDGIVDGFSLSSGGIGIWGNGDFTKKVFMGKKSVDYGTCAGVLNEESDSEGNTPIGDLESGTNICIRTSAKRIAVARLPKEGSAERVTLDITVWERS